MPTLRQDLLEEIISVLNVPDNQQETMKSLKRFMDSGKEPFEAVLKYFSNVNSVAVHDDHLTVVSFFFFVTGKR
uniref:Uncharacterized protein n=1 Tax=Panagrolaimus superbus TaxID=310955 RepID=A0A914Y0D7_9BILA